jgi:hypothetical protein
MLSVLTLKMKRALEIFICRKREKDLFALLKLFMQKTLKRILFALKANHVIHV